MSTSTDQQVSPRPPSLTAFLTKHPAYVFLGLTLWSLLISLFYVRAYLGVFRAEAAWFSLDPLQFATTAFSAYANGLIILTISAALIPDITVVRSTRIRRVAWWVVYSFLVFVVLFFATRPLFELGEMPRRSIVVLVVSYVVGTVWLVAVLWSNRMMRARGERGTVQSFMLDVSCHDDETRRTLFGLAMIGLFSMFWLAVGIGQVAGWNEALSVRGALRVHHERYVEFLPTLAEGGHELDVPYPATEHIVFSDGNRQLVAHMTETSIWIALEEGDTVIDPCVIVLRGGVAEGVPAAE